MNSDQNKAPLQKKCYYTWGIAAIIIIIAVFLLVLFLNGKNETTSDNVEVGKTSSALVCTSNSENGSLFHTNGFSTVKQEIRGTFSNEILQNLTYAYSAEYPNHETAKSAITTVHIDYDTYVGERNINNSDFIPNYSTDKNTIKASFYADAQDITPTATKIFSIALSEGQSDINLSLTALQDNYIKQGFDCKIINN